MALVTIDDSSSSSSSKHLKFESIPFVDLRLFTQSELNSLSQCSKQSFDLHHCDEIVIPKIDRSIFNESAGSRKQTYSRLRLAPRLPDIERRHRRFLPLSKTPQNPISIDDPERQENKRIVTLLKELFSKDDPGTQIVPILRDEVEDEDPSFPQPLNVEENGGGVVVSEEGEKRKGAKRGRKIEDNPKGNMQQGNGSKAIVAYNQDTVMEIVNCKDVVVDIVALANMDDPFGPELKRRAAGLETEVELLGFLGGLEGKWGSRRKKKRIVDASYFGDHLPKGWKLLISIKKKGGQMWLNCRQYISPNGLKFGFCKEVSSYLQSVFGTQETNQPNPYQGDEIRRDNKLTSEEIAGLTHGYERTREDLPSPALQSLSTEHENQAVLLRVENLSDVEVKDLLECQKCKKSFVKKDAYLLHLLTSHQSASRCGLSTSVCDGLVTRDGKLECQICHEAFQENHQYNDHIKVHMKNYAESLEALPNRTSPKSELLFLSGVPSGISNFDESVDIDNCSISQPSAELNDGMNVMDPAPGSINSQFNSELNVGSPYRYHDTGGMGCIPQISAAKPNESSPHIKLAVNSKPPSAAKSKSEGYVGSPYSKNIEDDKMDSSGADESCDEQYRGYEIANDKLGEINPQSDLDDENMGLTLAGESCAKQYICNEIADDMLVETNDPNRNHVIGDDKMDLTLAGKSCSKQYIGNEIADDRLGKTNDSNIDLDIGDDKMDLSLAGESNDKQYRGYEIANEKLEKINDPKSNNGIGDDKIDLSLAGESYDKPYGGSDIANDKLREINDAIRNHHIGDDTIDLTLASELCGKQYRGYEIADEKLGEINDPNSNLYVQFNSCMESASTLGNSEEFGTFKSSDAKYVLGSTISEIDKYTLEQEAGSSCWLTLSCGDQINGVATSNGIFSIREKNSQLGETRDSGNNEPDNHFGARHSGHDKGVITGTAVSMGENILEDMTSGPSSLLVKSSDRFPTLNLISTQVENDFYADNQKHEKVLNFQELGLDDMEASKFNNFMTGQASSSAPQEPMDLAYHDTDLEQGFGNTSVQFDWDTVLPKMSYSHQQVITTLCVWCGAEFSHEAVNLELESDSVGFMCPTCKAKISGQLFGIG